MAVAGVEASEHVSHHVEVTAGTVNPVTGKRSLDDRYRARTIRHSNAVIRAFYEYWLELGQGPLINPMPLDRYGQRLHAHHNPSEVFVLTAAFDTTPNCRSSSRVKFAMTSGCLCSACCGPTGTEHCWRSQ